MTQLATANIKLLLTIFTIICACGYGTNAIAANSLTLPISDLSKLEGSSGKTHKVQLSVAGRDYTIRLWPSHIAPVTTGTKSQHFKGKVIGDDESWVRLSYLNKQLSGHMKAFGELLEIDTLSNTAGKKHIARKIDSTDLENHTSGTDRVLQAPPLTLSKLITASNLTPRELNGTNVTRIMRLSIVVDSRFDAHYNGQGLEEAISTINSVDGLYQEQFGLAIQLDSAVLLSEANDPFQSYNGNIEQVLRAFRNYSLENKKIYQGQTAVHLFSGTSDIDNIIGLSWINTACRRDGYNASVSTPFSEQMLLAAHELAHNLGAVHDNEKSCDIEYNQVMWPNISSATASRFSNCSKSAIVPKLNASCNLDNIDIGISLELRKSSAFEKKSELLVVTAHNTHTYRDASDIRSATLIQNGITVSNLPKQCFELAETIYCDHNDIKALSKSSVEFNISYSTTNTQIVISEIDAPTTNDVTNSNDNATLDLNNPEKNTGNNTDTNTPYTMASAGGAGSLGTLSTLALLLMSTLRANTRHRLPHKQRC